MADRIRTKGEVAYHLVRSMDRLKKHALEALEGTAPEKGSQEWMENREFIAWHDRLVKEAQRLGLLPDVVFTPRSKMGERYGVR